MARAFQGWTVLARAVAAGLASGVLAAHAHAESFVGKVVAVHDGDTISVMRSGRAERVRLDGVDSPERGQDYSKHARVFLADMVFGKVVSVEVRDTDRYGRTVGRVALDGRDAGLELVRAGLAWHVTRYSTDAALARAEREARTARRGLWALPKPVPPWEFRHRTSRARGVASLVARPGSGAHFFTAAASRRCATSSVRSVAGSCHTRPLSLPKTAQIFFSRATSPMIGNSLAPNACIVS